MSVFLRMAKIPSCRPYQNSRNKSTIDISQRPSMFCLSARPLHRDRRRLLPGSCFPCLLPRTAHTSSLRRVPARSTTATCSPPCTVRHPCTPPATHPARHLCNLSCSVGVHARPQNRQTSAPAQLRAPPCLWSLQLFLITRRVLDQLVGRGPAATPLDRAPH